MTTPPELREAYLATQIDVEIEPAEWVPIDEAVKHLPTPLHLITAWNPFSQELSFKENYQRQEDLFEVIAGEVALWFSAVGKSPSGDWQEDTLAIFGLRRDRAIEIGKQFEQHAIFEATDTELIVLSCDGSWEVHRELETATSDVENLTPASETDLSDSISSALGISLNSKLVRASYPGWEYEGCCGARCATCQSPLELFGCTALGKDGSQNRLMAFVCRDCETIKWPHDVDESTRECAKLWRKVLFAIGEAKERNAKETYYAYVIELEGEVDTRSEGCDPNLPWVYVGQSAKPPPERLEQHLEGYKASRWVTKFGSHLRPDLYAGHPELRNRLSALAYETWLAESLRNRGYPVKGGH